jgi:hypothetical protein
MDRLAPQGAEASMTGTAWAMLGATWLVIVVFTGRLFLKVLRTPQRVDDE